MVQHGLLSFRPMEVILTHKRKVKKHEAKPGSLQGHCINFMKS